MADKEKRFFKILLIFVAAALVIGIIFLGIKQSKEDKGETSSSKSTKESTASTSETKREATEPSEALTTEPTDESTTPEPVTEPSTEATTESTTPEPTTPEPTTQAPTETAAPAPSKTYEFTGNTGTIKILSWITPAFLEVNPYSRPGTALGKVNNIVVHWVGNPGSSADGNREYFANLKDKERIGVSSHFIIGLDGEILYIVPNNEVAYCNYPRNDDTISIENCHPDWDGQFNSKTYNSLIKLCAYLCEQYGLTADALIRHHDVSGKDCPRYYVNHPDAWNQLKEDVRAYMAAHPDIMNENP